MSDRIVGRIVWDEEEQMSRIEWDSAQMPMGSADVNDQQFVVDVVDGVSQDIELMELIVHALVYAEYGGRMH
jgi:enoyl-[acyl-carrier-protein] reductase (NADH)